MFFTNQFSIALMLLAISLPASAYRVLIDPGHGGRDKGAMQASYDEASIAWAWSLELKKQLLAQNLEVEMTRNETTGLSLASRVGRTNRKKYDLVVSLHANYLLDSRVKGIEFFLSTPLELEDQKLQLAHEEVQLQKGYKKTNLKLSNLKEEQKSQVSAIIHDLERQALLKQSMKIATDLNQAWPGKIKQGPFDLLNQSDSPAILIELGYLSNPLDLKNLNDPQFRLEKNLKIAEVISSYFRNQKSKIIQ